MVDRHDEVHVMRAPEIRGDSNGPAIGPKYHLGAAAKNQPGNGRVRLPSTNHPVARPRSAGT